MPAPGAFSGEGNASSRDDNATARQAGASHRIGETATCDGRPKNFHATVRWQREGVPFTDGRYSRVHVWLFDEGLEVPASSAPSSVPLPFSRPDAVDPEEALVAAASSCHMLFALDFARRAGFRIDSYEDAAEGVLSPNEKGRLFMSRINLRPVMVFSGEKIPTPEDLAALHHQAHDACYVAHSLRADISVSPQMRAA